MTKAIIIRQATRDDATAIHELHMRSVKELWTNHYSSNQISGWLNPRTPEVYFPAIDQGILFVAIEDSIIVGFGEAIPGEVWAIYVSPDRAREGIGSILLNHAIEIAKSGSKEVIVEASLNSIGFYRKRGFVEIHKKFSRHGTVELPCVLMEYRATT